MNGGRWHRGLRYSLILIAMQVATSTFLAHRSDAAGAADSVSASEVAAGLQRIQGIAEDVAGVVKADKSKAQKLVAGIEPEWKKIEDVVRAADSDTYISLEDAFAALGAAAKAGDAPKAAAASSAITASVKSYLSQHPGDAGAVAPETTVTAPAPVAESTTPPSAAAPAEAPAPVAAPPARQAEAAAPVAATPQASRAARPGGLPRTGPHAGLVALAGSVLASGGLALMGGAGRRRGRRTLSPPSA